jgi:hypothetical protein
MDWTLRSEAPLPTEVADGGDDHMAHEGSTQPGHLRPHPCAPRRPARIKSTRFNWGAVRLRYVTGVSGVVNGPPGAREWPSLAEVAREYGASLGRVEAVSARDGWPEQRESFRQRLQVEEDRLVLSRLASRHVRARYAAFVLAGKILEQVEARLKQEDVSPKELLSLARAAQRSQEISEIAINGALRKPAQHVEKRCGWHGDWP